MDQLNKVEQERFNEDILPYLDKAQAFMKLNDAKANVKTLNTVLDGFCAALKTTDELFNKLFCRLVYSGSYYDRLRIKSADEFDINVVLKIPAKGFPPFQLEASPDSGAFLGYCVDKSKLSAFAGTNGWPKALAELFSDSNEKCWLNMTLVRRWFQRLLAKLPHFTGIDGVTGVKFSESGPAKTLLLSTVSGRIDIDLVPVFEIPYGGLPQRLRTDGKILKLMKRKHSKPDESAWFLVPKELQPTGNPLYWRLHSPFLERNFMDDSGCLKPTIRLLKLLRDSQGWHYISSYALKTLVISRALEVSDHYWDKTQPGIVFYDMLERLRQALLSDGIPYLYSSKVDLLQNCSSATRSNYAGRIGRMLKKLKSDPEVILKYLKVPADTSSADYSLDASPGSSPEQQHEPPATPLTLSVSTTSAARSETDGQWRKEWLPPENPEVFGSPKAPGAAKHTNGPLRVTPMVETVGHAPTQASAREQEDGTTGGCVPPKQTCTLSQGDAEAVTCVDAWSLSNVSVSPPRGKPGESTDIDATDTSSTGTPLLKNGAPLLHDVWQRKLTIQERRLEVEEKRFEFLLAMFQQSLQGSSPTFLRDSPGRKRVGGVGAEAAPGQIPARFHTFASRLRTRSSGQKYPGRVLERELLRIVQQRFKQDAAQRRREVDLEERRLHLEERRLQFEIDSFKAKIDLEREVLEERKRCTDYQRQQIDLMTSMLEELKKQK